MTISITLSLSLFGSLPVRRSCAYPRTTVCKVLVILVASLSGASQIWGSEDLRSIRRRLGIVVTRAAQVLAVAQKSFEQGFVVRMPILLQAHDARAFLLHVPCYAQQACAAGGAPRTGHRLRRSWRHTSWVQESPRPLQGIRGLSIRSEVRVATVQDAFALTQHRPDCLLHLALSLCVYMSAFCVCGAYDVHIIRVYVFL